MEFILTEEDFHFGELESLELKKISSFTEDPSQPIMAQMPETCVDPSYQITPQIELVAVESFSVERSPGTNRRPGRLPGIPDEELTPIELDRRQRRRERNRKAAARVRSRRLAKEDTLLKEIKNLKESTEQLRNTNSDLKRQLEKLQRDIEQQNKLQDEKISDTVTSDDVFVDEKFPALKQLEQLKFDQQYTLTFTPLKFENCFDFPIVSDESLRTDSFNEIHHSLNVM